MKRILMFYMITLMAACQHNGDVLPRIFLRNCENLTDYVTIFVDSSATRELCRIVPSAKSSSDDWFFITEITDKTDSTFKIKAELCDYISISSPIIGWVKKAECKVYCFEERTDSNNNCIKEIYEFPSYSSNRQEIITRHCSDNEIEMDILDWNPIGNWLKVRMTTRGGDVHIGWTQRYKDD